MADRGYELEPAGSDLRIRVWGRDEAGCLAAAVEGLAASLADLPVDATCSVVAVEAAGAGPVERLVGVVDEAIALLDIDGLLAVGVASLDVVAGRARARLEVVPLGEVEVRGVAPKAATWHDAALAEEADGRWRGRLVVDL